MTAAAILRIADGLDCTRTQSSTIEGVRRVDEGLQIIVGGPDSARGALCARERGKLWRRVWGAPIYAESALPLSTGLLRMLEQPSRPRPAGPGIIPDEPMAEAGRKVLAFHLQRMLKHEPGTREGSDIEELHDMRVATRRLRAAFRVFGDYWKSSAATPLVDGLRATGRALGAVRDLDVLINKAHLYLDGFGEAESDLTPLFEAWGQLREERRQEMVAYLDSDDYKRFCIVLTDFSTTPGMGARSVEASDPVPYLVAHVAPFAIYHRWAQVMAFGAWLGQAPIATLHALRIHAKNLRYTLEFFEEVLGPDADKVIQRVVGLQDHLGSLQDASVAGDMVRDLINQWAEEEASRSAMERIDIHGVTGYLAAIQEQIHVLVEHMPDVWATLDSDSVRAKLAAAVSVL
jgi:CHAD domain-containing protein